MATEKRLIPDGKQVTLGELLPGTIFYYDGNAFDCIAVKSEYICRNGLIEAYIVDSGELFWGGAKTVAEQYELMVQPLAIVEVDAVEVAHGRWIEKQEAIPWCEDDVEVYTVCSVCESYSPGESNYCPNCGAKMDGERRDNGQFDA